jgi:anti-sigma factor RsiW
MNDDEIRGLFSEMGGEEIPAESLARVRRAVGAAVEARRRTLGWWKVAVMLAAAGCLAVVMVRVRTEQVPVRLPVVVQAPVVAVQQSAPVEVAPVVAHKPVRAVAKPVRQLVKQLDAAPIQGGAAEIRIESSDEPDVVILLIGG